VLIKIFLLLPLPFKAVVNIRTDRLVEYVQAIKLRNKKRDKADKLRVKMPQHTQEVQVAMQEEEKVSESAGAWIPPPSPKYQHVG